MNGGLCTPFKAGIGDRQGCSLSGMLYSIATEPLLQQIRIKLDGVQIPGFNCNVHLSAYADNVIVMINNQNDVQILLKLLEDFKGLSSAKVNWNKSEALVCGNRARKIASPTSRGYCVFQSGYQNVSRPCPTGYLKYRAPTQCSL